MAHLNKLLFRKGILESEVCCYWLDSQGVFVYIRGCGEDLFANSGTLQLEFSELVTWIAGKAGLLLSLGLQWESELQSRSLLYSRA